MTGDRRPPLTGQARLAIGVAGVGIGILYVLSPLTVWFAAAMVVVLALACRGLDEGERRWVLLVLVVAVLARVAAVAMLFLMTDHRAVPFGHFFGDEEYFIKRSIWLRNVALGIPIHGADLIYAFDDYSQTSYLYILAFVQVLVGPAPYGVHLLGIGCFVAGSVLMFRLVRPRLGRMPAFIGLVILLFLPSQFAWSVSALKDPLFFLLTAATVALGLRLVRGPSPAARLLACAAIALLAVVLETIRSAGAALVVVSLLTGVAAGALVVRPRWLLALTMAVPIAVGGVLSYPIAQVKAYAAVQAAVRQHWGHIATPGYVYRLLDQRLYEDKGTIDDLQFGEAARFLVRAVTRYVTVPLPSEAQSAAALAYLPEQLVWYIILAFGAWGVFGALRRDPVLGGLLFGYTVVAALTVAVTSGNVGTLVRHRGLALPFLVWLSGVGACDLISWSRGRTSGTAANAGDSPPVLMRVQPTCR